jgi:hypothetical protein
MKGQALVVDPETGEFTDPSGNKIDAKMAAAVLIYDEKS